MKNIYEVLESKKNWKINVPNEFVLGKVLINEEKCNYAIAIYSLLHVNAYYQGKGQGIASVLEICEQLNIAEAQMKRKIVQNSLNLMVEYEIINIVDGGYKTPRRKFTYNIGERSKYKGQGYFQLTLEEICVILSLQFNMSKKLCILNYFSLLKAMIGRIKAIQNYKGKGSRVKNASLKKKRLFANAGMLSGFTREYFGKILKAKADKISQYSKILQDLDLMLVRQPKNEEGSTNKPNVYTIKSLASSEGYIASLLYEGVGNKTMATKMVDDDLKDVMINDFVEMFGVSND